MVSTKNNALKKARKDLIRQIFDKIKNVSLDKLYTNTYITLAHVWLHKEAEKQGLLDKGIWSILSREELLEKIWTFLKKNIK